ncbi:MAG: hypothetical protein WKF84_18325 [Pyrinomonadaceae bacterium]
MHLVEVAVTDQTLLDNPGMVLNMGPQHPSTHGVLRVILRLDGETVIDLDCDIGYLHRGMEKIAENRLYPMIAPYWDRLDYISAVSNGLVWVETVEQMMGLQIAAARSLHSHDSRGIESHLFASSLARDAWFGHRLLHCSFMGSQGARRNTQDLRATIRGAADVSCVAHRRHAERSLRRV